MVVFTQYDPEKVISHSDLALALDSRASDALMTRFAWTGKNNYFCPAHPGLSGRSTRTLMIFGYEGELLIYAHSSRNGDAGVLRK